MFCFCKVVRYLRTLYADFQEIDYFCYVKEPFVCSKWITKLVVSGMEVSIRYSLSRSKSSEPWLHAYNLFLYYS